MSNQPELKEITWWQKGLVLIALYTIAIVAIVKFFAWVVVIVS